MNMKFKKVLALLLVFVMLFAVAPSNVFAADGTTDTTDTTVTDTPVTDGTETEEPEEDVNIKGDVLTTADGQFEYYKYELTDEETGETSYIIEIKRYLGTDKEVVISEDLGEEAPYTVQIIGDEAFLDKSEILKVTLPETLKKIGLRAFCNCTNLYSINLPDSLVEIDGWAFHECVSIAGIHMPANIESIGANAFFGCTSLTGNAYIPSEIPNEDGTYPMIAALTFPSTLTHIGDNAFGSCSSLINVIIPGSVTAIYTGTFANCVSLEKVDIPYSVTYVGAAFNGAFESHSRVSVYEPTLIIRNPHCVIDLSDSMDAHTVVKGVRYSLVNHMAEEGGYTFEAINPPAEHNYTYSGVVTPATCLEEGYTTYTCDCGMYDDFCITDYEPATGHSYGDWYLGGTGEGDESTRVDPADVYVISAGDDSGLSSSVPSADDLFGEETTEDSTAAEDTTTEGETTEEDKSQLMQSKAITKEEFEAIRKAGVYKPFCTVGEGISRKCTECGHIENGNKIPEGHKIYNVTSATCTEYGVVREMCAACGIQLSQKTAVPYGHTFAEETETVSVYKKCSTNGVVRSTCTTCGGTVDEITPAHKDSDKNLVCDDCGATLEATDCGCACHKSGFFWDIINQIRLIVWKLFKIERLCDCGVPHY